ncbi:GvpL/GvpF family gas vesicle protein [Nocardia jinanensis]|uniref:Gas vesicle protein n=1 Tax=Nocardia jinanensis TaxID=382504 RepID=A0A917VXN8_9NOCA|nr:GvpL/GvpF family gas vesicle protein [Nocardia jinanensis]GGL31066.1 gas vesicle protein [Nocardia jinanensis]
MSTASTTSESSRDQRTGVYVYGIVAGDVEPEPHAQGIGDPPADVAVVRHGDIAALVSEVSLDLPLGMPDDLTAHARLLDGTAAVAPVLPLQFGGVVTDTEAVEKELLAPNHDQFRSALDDLEGRAQYVIRGRYTENTVLQEILDENADAARLRAEIRDKSEDATRNARIELGEIMNRGIEAKRAEDTRRVAAALGDLDPTVRERQPTHEEDAVHLALLLDLSREDDLLRALTELGEEWDGRVRLNLLGPMAPYDFVTAGEAPG